MSESDNNDVEALINEIITDLGLRPNKPTINKIQGYADQVGLDKIKIVELYNQEKEKEDYANEFMVEEGLKGKNTLIKIMKIIDMVGFSKPKVKTAFLRSTIASRIKHDWEKESCYTVLKVSNWEKNLIFLSNKLKIVLIIS